MTKHIIPPYINERNGSMMTTLYYLSIHGTIENKYRTDANTDWFVLYYDHADILNKAYFSKFYDKYATVYDFLKANKVPVWFGETEDAAYESFLEDNKINNLFAVNFENFR